MKMNDKDLNQFKKNQIRKRFLEQIVYIIINK